jgi:hypothetical protein
VKKKKVILNSVAHFRKSFTTCADLAGCKRETPSRVSSEF